MTFQWLAGFIDGEGTIRVRVGGQCMTPTVQIAQSDNVTLQRVKEWLLERGITSTGPYGYDKGKFSNRPCFYLRIERRASAIKLLKAIVPHLVVKRTLAQDCLRFARLFPELDRGIVFSNRCREAAIKRNAAYWAKVKARLVNYQ